MNETQIQRAVFQHFRERGAPGVFAFHSPNGGYRKPIESAIFKGLGVVSGVPDVIAIKDGHFYALELKAEDGRLSDNQKLVLARLGECGAICAVAFGLSKALRQLEEWELLKGWIAG